MANSKIPEQLASGSPQVPALNEDQLPPLRQGDQPATGGKGPDNYGDRERGTRSVDQPGTANPEAGGQDSEGS